MSRSTASLLFLIFIAGAPLARPDDAPALSADTGWQRLEEKDGVTIYSRSRVGAGYKEFKATGLIDSPPATVERVLEDVQDYVDFMPYVSEVRILSQDGPDMVAYQRLNVPFVANRDYTVRVEHGTARNASGVLFYRDTWQTANEAGPPEQRGTVRVKVNEGSWILETGTDANSTQATYQIFTDSGGVIPAFLANRASQLIIPKLFEAIRKQAHDPKYQH